MAKKEKIEDLFNEIAPEYDRLNHLLSLNIDKRWRKKAIRKIENPRTVRLLDVACGTGDFAIAAAKYGVPQIVGVDISERMLEIGRTKVGQLGWNDRITLRQGDSEQLDFADNTFDVVTVAFGVRNFEHLTTGLREMHRVLKPGGQIIILEFSLPEFFPVKQLYQFYFRRILPLIGGWISGSKGAYMYLPESVSSFPYGKAFVEIMRECGFPEVKRRRLTMGVATIYGGKK